MTRTQFRPALFLFTGLLWMLLASAVGLVLFLALVRGVPSAPAMALIHAHGAMAGGVAQIVLGALAVFLPSFLMMGENRSHSHPVLFTAINAGAIGMAAGFGFGQNLLVGAAGMLVIFAFLSLCRDAFGRTRWILTVSPLDWWLYGLAGLGLLTGLLVGEAMALRMGPQTMIGYLRLAHIHFILQGFLTLAIVGAMHTVFPTIVRTALYSAALARFTYLFLPLGTLVLMGGFLSSGLWIEIAGGLAMLIAATLYGSNIVRTWISAGKPRNTALDHLLMATFFLVVTMGGGLLVATNALWDPPRIPFGRLHLVAYTHLAFLGFILQTILGALTHYLPSMLADERTTSHKKRERYLAELTDIVERWRAVQVSAFNLGTIGLSLVAALVWQVSLTSLPVQTAAWLSAGLLFLSLGLFGMKMVLLVISQPTQESD